MPKDHRIALRQIFVWGAALLILVAGALPSLAEEPAEVDAGSASEISTASGDAIERQGEGDAADDIDVAAEGKEDAGLLDEMVVTTNRRAENLQDVAVSVTALSGSFVEDVGLTDFAAMQKFTPNLNIVPAVDSRSTSIRIRGIGSTGSNAGIDPSVGVFLDDIYQGRAGMSVSDLLDIESIEILRGPQGTLYGKNTAAGAIKVTTKDPTYELTGQGEFVVGSYDNYEGRFSLNVPIVDDTLATRLTAYGVGRRGWDNNHASESYDDINDVTKWGVRSKTLWDVTDTLSLKFSADYSGQDNTCCAPDVIRYGEPIPGVPALLPTATEVAALLDIDLPKEDPNDRVVDVDDTPSDENTITGGAIEATFDFNDFIFTSLTSYRYYDSESLFDGDFSSIPAITWYTEEELNQVSSELRMVTPSHDLFEVVAGLYFYYSELDTDDRLTFKSEYMGVTFDQPPPIPPFPPFPPPHEPQEQYNIGDNTHKTTNVAGYANSEFYVSEFWDNTPKISLSGGIRVGWEEKKRNGTQESEGVLGDFPSPISGPKQVYNQDRDVTNVSGRGIIRYEPTDDIMLYTSYATGFKSGGFNQLRTNGADEAVPADEIDDLTEFDDEKSKSVEAGLRTQWFDRMLTANITGFYTLYDDFQAMIFDGTFIWVENAGEMESYGFEADFTVVPIPQLMTMFSIGFNKAKYKDFEKGPCNRDEPEKCNEFGFQDLSGEKVDNAPEWTFTVFTQWEDRFPFFDVDYFVQADYQFIDERFLSVSLDPELKADTVNLLGLRAGFRHPEDRWEIVAWMKNVTNEDFWVVGFDVPTLGGKAVILAPPRQYGLTLRASF